MATEPITNANDDMLAKLDEAAAHINTQDQGFGLMGILEKQERDNRRPAQQDAQLEPTPAPVDDEPPKWLDVINTRIQETSRNIEQGLQQVRGEVAQARQQAPQGFTGADTEAEDPYFARDRQVESKVDHLTRVNAYDRAKNSLDRLKNKYPDADLDENYLRQVWQNEKLDSNLQRALGANWDVFFEQEYSNRARPKMQERLKQLEAEVTRYKAGANSALNEMSSVPGRTSRQASNAVQSASNNRDGIDEDVYKRASSRMSKGQFKGFGRAVTEELRGRQLRSAV